MFDDQQIIPYNSQMNSMTDSQCSYVQPCTICFCDPTQPTCTENCRHIFCKDCLQKWALKSNRCPTCKTEFQLLVSPNGLFKTKKIKQTIAKSKKDMTQEEIKERAFEENLFRMLTAPETRQRGRQDLNLMEMICEMAQVQCPWQE